MTANEREAQDWAAWLDAAAGDAPAYRYPIEERLTRTVEDRQDPGKRRSEIAAIRAAADIAWTTALDFGCGGGENFAALAESGAARDWRLLAVDADPRQAELARARAAAMPAAERIRVYAATIDTLAAAPRALRLDFALCCQVIGHTPRTVATRIVGELAGRLAPGGRLCLLFPVALPAARELAFAADAPPGADLHHLVDAARDHEDPAFRTLIDADAFDAAAARPEPGLLPVRAFAVAGWDPEPTTAAPAAAPAIPRAIAEHLPAGTAWSAQLYSVHARGPRSGRPAIGDMAVTITG